MLYVKNTEATVLVLDRADLLRLRDKPIGTPDGKIMLAATPDLAWVAASFQEAEANGGLTPQKILSILATDRARTQGPNPHAP